VVIEEGPVSSGAVLGGFVARSWQDLGSTGILTSGLVRDSAEINELGYPMYAAGTTPAANSGRWVLTEVGGSARLPERAGTLVTIRSGDLIIGDADGVSIIPQEHAEGIVAAAERLLDIEKNIRAALVAGQGRREAFAANPRFDHIPRFI
jgi:regulator of RNase E activity RraA